MTECITQLSLFDHPKKRLDVTFDAPQISSDGGLLLLRRAAAEIGICEAISDLLPDDRELGKVRHSRLEQIRQRVFMIACGYEDCVDANYLRHDPLLKTVCDSSPRDEAGLSCQSTLSRLENLVSAETVVQIQRKFEDEYVASLPLGTKSIVLDIDATDDETHGAQQLAFFHGYYDHYMYHPVMVFDGKGQLISFRLRAGNTHSSRLAAPMLSRIIQKIKRRVPKCRVIVRADSGFCVPRVLCMLESLDKAFGRVDYVLGIARNSVLQSKIIKELERAGKLCEETGGQARVFTDFLYAAGSWHRKRRVIAKAEYTLLGANPRFVLTSFGGDEPEQLYEFYCARGECENRIKDFKNALMADRLSCSSFVANAFRMCLHAAAYRVMYKLRENASAVNADLGCKQFDTLRLKLLKVGAMITESVRRIRIRLPEAYPLKHIFALMLLTPS
jgi:hypothetical protein